MYIFKLSIQILLRQLFCLVYSTNQEIGCGAKQETINQINTVATAKSLLILLSWLFQALLFNLVSRLFAAHVRDSKFKLII